MNRAIHKAVFLDRDGVINHDPENYTWEPSKFRLLPGVIDALRHWQDLGFKLIVITNQGGVAKGLYGRSDVALVHAYLCDLLCMQNINLTDIFYAPYHADIGASISRKPSGYMLQRAIALHDIDTAKSFMIGDRQGDAEAAYAVGISTFVIPRNAGLMTLKDLIY